MKVILTFTTKVDVEVDVDSESTDNHAVDMALRKFDGGNQYWGEITSDLKLRKAKVVRGED